MYSRFLPGLTGGGPFDDLEAPAVEEALSHEIGQAKHGKLDAVHPGRDADQGVGNHGRNDPQAKHSPRQGQLALYNR